jgi:4-amino-4-deoxy-L-arabinose transferase-like glycosyltransferase
MKHFVALIRTNKSFATIILIGLLVRLLFLTVGAKIYYGREDFFLNGDTSWWVSCIVNLIEHGTYTSDFSNELAYFVRTPAYSFFIGFFYLLSGKNLELAYQLVIWTQVLVDIISIYFIYQVTLSIFKQARYAMIAAALYAIYPFIIVWNPVVYAESFSVFLLLWFIHIYLKANTNKLFLFSGILLGIAILTRIQLIVFIPIVLITHLFRDYRTNRKLYLHGFAALLIGITITYGSWPARNYFNHGKLIFAQHLGDALHFSPDYMYYMYYIWSVKTDHEPQFTQIMKGEQIEFPPASFAFPSDSILLDRVVLLMRNCGEGVSYFSRTAGYRSDVVKRGEDCNSEIVGLFKTLIQHQKKYNTINYYIKVPLSNLKKALFKFDLKKEQNPVKLIMANGLFLYRTFMILIGFIGLIIIFIKDKTIFYSPGTLIILSYFIFWYLFQSAYYRNMEIRFLIHADVLMLIPAAFGIDYLLKLVRKPKQAVS